VERKRRLAQAHAPSIPPDEAQEQGVHVFLVIDDLQNIHDLVKCRRLDVSSVQAR
jgi:hypothetical protein